MYRAASRRPAAQPSRSGTTQPCSRPSSVQPHLRGLPPAAAATAAEPTAAQGRLRLGTPATNGAYQLSTPQREPPVRLQQQLPQLRHLRVKADLHGTGSHDMQLQQQCGGRASDQQLPPRKPKGRRQQQSQHKQWKPVTDEQRTKFRAALQRCDTWEQLADYLQAEQQQQQPCDQQPVWQQLSSDQALLTLQQATQLASRLQRRKQQLQPQNPAAAAGAAPARQHASVGQLQPIIRELVSKAASGVVSGDAVAAAQVLRASWKLQVPQQRGQQQQEGQQLQQVDGRLRHQMLDCMSAGWSQRAAPTGPPSEAAVQGLGSPPAASAAPAMSLGAGVIMPLNAAAAPMAGPAAGVAASPEEPQALRNANLLADVSAAVVQLKLKPSGEWTRWYRDTNISMMQPQQRDSSQQPIKGPHLQQQEETGAVSSWFLVNALLLAQYLDGHQSQQQKQQLQTFPDMEWKQAWGTAAAALEHPFSSTQLLLVMTAAVQLSMQLPSSFWNAHLHPQGVAAMEARELIRLLKLLAQHQHQQGQQPPPSWLSTAAEALPAAVEEAPGDAAVHRLLPGAVVAAARLKLPVNQAGIEQLVSALLATSQQAATVTGPTTATVAAGGSTRSNDSRSSAQHLTCPLRLVPANEACSAVGALAQLSKQQKHQPPPGHLLRQVQQQLRPLLLKASTSSIVLVLWALAVVWRAPLSTSFTAMAFGVTAKRLRSCRANDLRLLAIAVTAAATARPTAGPEAGLRVPTAWVRRYLQCTATMMVAKQGSGSSSSTSSSTTAPARPWQTPSLPPQQRFAAGSDDLPTAEAVQHAGILSNVACCLARLKVTPDMQWQAVWRQQVLSHLDLMKPDQLVDVLYAAACWATEPAAAAAEHVTAAAAATGVGQSNKRAAEVHGGSPAASRGQSSPVSVVQPPAVTTAAGGTAATSATTATQLQQQLLPRPVLMVPGTSEETAAAGRAPALVHSTTPSEAWVNAVLLQLRQQLPHCKPKQLTTVLWCLNKLRFKASVPWLDAVYDTLMVQLQQCSLLQLQQLLRGLLHQGLELAPARIDLVLEAALQRLQQGQLVSSQQADGHRVICNSGSGRWYACTEQQLVWLLQLVVKLKHDPEPDWGRAVTKVAQRMLLRCSSSSSSSSGWDPALLTDLVESFAQLGVQLPARWLSTYRQAVWAIGLRRFCGLQLARLLSALATSHCTVVAKPFMQRLLRQLARQLPSMDSHALGLAGVALGQLGLMPSKQWSDQYMRQVQKLVQSRVRVAVSDVGNLQRSVQYLRWCTSCSRTKSKSRVTSSATGTAGSRKLRYRRKHNILEPALPHRKRVAKL